MGVVAGLDPETGEPFITGMDLIGAMAPTTNFVVCGNNEESLFGVCESMYKENLEPEELFEVIAQCLLAGVNRDCLSGWGGVVHSSPRTSSSRGRQGTHGLTRESAKRRVGSTIDRSARV